MPTPVLLRRAAAVVRAAHAGPTVAVTGFALAFGAVGAGLPVGTTLLLGAAVASGQLAIGWGNDLVDARRDTAAGRRDKPLATGEVGRATLLACLVVALTACVVLSLRLGPWPGAVHLVAVGSGLAYDLGLKSTPASPVPYAVSFGLLPAVATLAAAGPTWPAPALLVAAALLGVAAHLANTVADAEADTATGVRGLPQRIGPTGSAAAAGVLLVAAALVLLPGVLAGEGWRRGVAAALLGAGSLCGATASVQVLRQGAGRGRRAFWLVVVAAGLVVAGFVAS